MESDSDAESDAEGRPKSLTQLPADAVCQVLVALDNAYDIAQTASVCTLLNDAAKQAFILRPHLAKVADLAKQVAQLEIDAELQKHTIIPADQERLFAKLHTLEESLEAQTARADAAEARCSKLLRWVEEQKDRADKYKKELDTAEARCSKLARELEQQKARAEQQKARAEQHKERAEKYKERITRETGVRFAPRPSSSSGSLRRLQLQPREAEDARRSRSERPQARLVRSERKTVPLRRSSQTESDWSSSSDSDGPPPARVCRPRAAPRRRTRAD
jgi:chromosome segregation ATPase